MTKKLNYVFFACMIGWAFVVQQEPSKRQALTLPPGYDFNKPSEEEIYEKRYERALVARTLKFLSEGSDMNSFEHLSITPEQQTEFSKALDEYRELVEKLETFDDEQLKKLLNVKSIPPKPSDRERMLWVYRTKLEKAWVDSIAASMMEMQIDEIQKWAPHLKGGFAKTLTETPIGKALGLTEKQQEKIRKRCDKIGDRLFREYVKARLEAEELFAEVLNDEQIERLRKLYEPNSMRKYGVINHDLDMSSITRTLMYDYPQDAVKELLENTKFDKRVGISEAQRKSVFGVR